MTFRFNSVELTETSIREPPKTKTELRGMFAEAVRNTQLLPPRGISCFGRAQKQRHFVFVQPPLGRSISGSEIL